MATWGIEIFITLFGIFHAIASSAWWGDFTEEVSSAKWAATLLQGIITGTAAVLGAIWIFRRQLAADRTLARNERMEMQRAAQEEKRAAAASRIGRILIMIGGSESDLSNLELGAQLRSTSMPPGKKLMESAREEAKIYFPHFNQHIAETRAKESDVLWRVGRKVADADSSLTDYALGHALRKMLKPAHEDLRSIGHELIRWHGHSTLPDCRAVATAEKPFPPTREAEIKIRAKWKEAAEIEMKAIALSKLGQTPRADRT